MKTLILFFLTIVHYTSGVAAFFKYQDVVVTTNFFICGSIYLSAAVIVSEIKKNKKC